MKWNRNNIYDSIKWKDTGIFYHPYKKSFFNWFKKQNNQSLKEWKYKLFKHMLEEDIQLMKEDKVRPEHIETYKTEFLGMGTSREVEWFCECIEHYISEFPDYKSYHENYLSGFIKEQINDVEKTMLWKPFGYSFKEKTALCKLSERVACFQRRLDRLESLRRYRAPQMMIKAQQEELWEAVESLKVSATEEEMQLLSNLYDDYDSFDIPAKYNKKTLEKFNKKATMIKELWKFFLLLGAPDQDIYRKSRRLPGAGWSNQK